MAWHAVRAFDAAGPLDLAVPASALRAAVIYPLLPPLGLALRSMGAITDPAANSEKGYDGQTPGQAPTKYE